MVLNQRPCCPTGDIWRCLETFSVVTTGSGKEGRGRGHLADRGQGGCGTSIWHRTASTTKIYPAPHTSSAKAENPQSRECKESLFLVFVLVTLKLAINMKSEKPKLSWLFSSLVNYLKGKHYSSCFTFKNNLLGEKNEEQPMLSTRSLGKKNWHKNIPKCATESRLKFLKICMKMSF